MGIYSIWSLLTLPLTSLPVASGCIVTLQGNTDSSMNLSLNPQGELITSSSALLKQLVSDSTTAIVMYYKCLSPIKL